MYNQFPRRAPKPGVCAKELTITLFFDCLVVIIGIMMQTTLVLQNALESSSLFSALLPLKDTKLQGYTEPGGKGSGWPDQVFLTCLRPRGATVTREGELRLGKRSQAQSPPLNDPRKTDPGAQPERALFAPFYQILIGAPRWELPLSTRGYTGSGSGLTVEVRTRANQHRH